GSGLQLFMGPTCVAVWSTTFWSRSPEGLRSGAVTGTQTWERPTRWVSGRHGSKPAPEMIRLTLWSLLISGSVPAASLAGTATFRATGISPGLAGSTPGVETNLVALEASG